MIQVGVIGGHKATRRQLRWAEQVGAAIASIPAVLVCGGLGGVMEAAARGARSAGGLTVGILPGERKESANDHITLRLPTGMGVGRNILVVRAADILFAIGGGPGTLSEIAYAIQLGVPIIALDSWKVGTATQVVRATDADDAVARAIQVLKVRHAP